MTAAGGVTWVPNSEAEHKDRSAQGRLSTAETHAYTHRHTQTHSSVNDFLSTLNRLIHLPLDEFQAEE